TNEEALLDIRRLTEQRRERFPTALRGTLAGDRPKAVEGGASFADGQHWRSGGRHVAERIDGSRSHAEAAPGMGAGQPRDGGAALVGVDGAQRVRQEPHLLEPAAGGREGFRSLREHPKPHCTSSDCAPTLRYDPGL